MFGKIVKTVSSVAKTVTSPARNVLGAVSSGMPGPFGQLMGGVSTFAVGGGPLGTALGAFGSILEASPTAPRVYGFPPSKLPTPPPITTTNNSLKPAVGALNQMQTLRTQMQSLVNNRNMSPEEKQAKMMELQQQMQMVQQLLQMMSTMMKKSHDISMGIIGNMR